MTVIRFWYDSNNVSGITGTIGALMHYILFYIFASIALLSAIFVIVAKNPVRAVLSLILCFAATAVTWLIMQAEFLAMILVLVYVGAVMVLFLFVVMMLDINYATLKAQFTRWFPVSLALVAALLAIIISSLTATALKPDGNLIAGYSIQASNAMQLGKAVFENYLLQFEIAGVMLLVAIIAAIGLIYRGPRARKVQSIAQQISVTPAQRVRLVDGD